MAEAWGRAPVDIGVGGSIPFIADLVEEFPRAQILVTGVEDPDSRAQPERVAAPRRVPARGLAEALLLERLDARRRADRARADGRSSPTGSCRSRSGTDRSDPFFEE